MTPAATTIRYRILVGLQFATAAALVLSGHQVLDTPWTWLPIGLGLAVGLWAGWTLGLFQLSIMPTVSGRATLVTSGPYRFVRHPMYFALLLAVGGFVFAPFAPWKVFVWGVLAIVLWVKSRIEEHLLRRRFPGYADYQRRSKRWLPGLW